MQNKNAMEWVIQGPTQQTIDEVAEAEKAARAMAHYRRVEQDFEEFKKMRDYVIKNMEYLRGRKVPIEVDSIQFLPNHECLILNDMLLVSFTEAMELIKTLKHEEEKNGN